MQLANLRRSKAEDASDADIPSTSGRQFTEATSDLLQSHVSEVVLAAWLYGCSLNFIGIISLTSSIHILELDLNFGYSIFAHNLLYGFATILFIIIMCLQHFGHSPLPAYEPAFDWENERSVIFGQRIQETPMAPYGRFI